MSKELVSYRENIFSKIKKILKKFWKSEKEETINEKRERIEKTDFFRNLKVDENREEERLKRLKKLYDNRELEEKNISNKDIDELIKMYDAEIEELRLDTARRV